MPLQSKLFRGDLALEACLIKDSAHVVPGTAGAHVGKIQTALELLDNARIETSEFMAKRYGRSTASAVLGYKTKRQIINRSYQSQTDNIVGKMTVAALDAEIAELERRRTARGDRCGDPVIGVSPRANTPRFGLTGAFDPASLRPRDLVQPRDEETFPCTLKILWQPAVGAGRTHIDQHGEALFHLTPYRIRLSESFPLPDGAIPFGGDVNPAFEMDILSARQAAEKKRPGLRNVLRVIPCPFVASSEFFALTDGGPGASARSLQGFPEFILLNTLKARTDKLSFLHEMIHAATGETASGHDKDPRSIFSTADNRTVLDKRHAKALSESFFGLGFGV